MSTALGDVYCKIISILRNPDKSIDKENAIIECFNYLRRLPIENYAHIGVKGSDETMNIHGETILHILCSVTAFTSSPKIEVAAYELFEHLLVATSVDPSLCNNMYKFAHVTSWSAMNKIMKSSSGVKPSPPLCGAGSTSLLHYAMYARNIRCMLLLLDSGARLTMLVPNLCRKSPRPFFYEPNHIVDCVLDRSPSAFATCGRFIHERPFDAILLRSLAYWVRWQEVRGLWFFLMHSSTIIKSVCDDSHKSENIQHKKLQQGRGLVVTNVLTNNDESYKRRSRSNYAVKMVLSIDPLCRIIKSYLQTPPGGLSIRAVIDAVSVDGGTQNVWEEAISQDGGAAMTATATTFTTSKTNYVNSENHRVEENSWNCYGKIDMRRKASSSRKHFFWSLPIL